MAHIVIERLIIYPPDFDTPHEPWIRTLYTTADGIPIPINIPAGIPLERQAVKDYLVSILPEYAAIFREKRALEPVHNLDIGQEFDIFL